MTHLTRGARKSLVELRNKISMQEQTVQALRDEGHVHSDALRHLEEMKDSLTLLR